MIDRIQIAKEVANRIGGAVLLDPPVFTEWDGRKYAQKWVFADPEHVDPVKLRARQRASFEHKMNRDPISGLPREDRRLPHTFEPPVYAVVFEDGTVHAFPGSIRPVSEDP
jgi:hypothetical protein